MLGCGQREEWLSVKWVGAVLEMLRVHGLLYRDHLCTLQARPPPHGFVYMACCTRTICVRYKLGRRHTALLLLIQW